ncbi:unnamed protein product [Spodoptera littoralis]|uniref:Cuticular protein n=1 Tax=Spodoptera littoralis TaxID=7109 RepID=A0A9P0I3J2_SPOLI|nr:unnamed protein product [Spodoptera littoralis]CAH1640696.1 unnamed protein product [Spodoptera littoralis]
MRTFIIITVLSALAACYSAADLPSEDMSRGYTVLYDDMSPEGRIVSSAELNSKSDFWIPISEASLVAPAVAGQRQYITKVFQAAPGVIINGLSVTYSKTPAYSYRSPLGSDSVIVSITSHPGDEIFSKITVYRRP